jgi:hypothetical protein
MFYYESKVCLLNISCFALVVGLLLRRYWMASTLGVCGSRVYSFVWNIMCTRRTKYRCFCSAECPEAHGRVYPDDLPTSIRKALLTGTIDPHTIVAAFL